MLRGIEGILTILIVHLTFQRSYNVLILIASRDIDPCCISKIYFYIDIRNKSYFKKYISIEQPNEVLIG